MAPTPWVRTGPGSRVGATSGPGCGADLHPPPSLAARQPWTSWEGCWCWTATRGSVRPRPWPTPTSASTTTPRTSPRPSPMTRAWRLRSAPWRSGRVGLGGWREMGGGAEDCLPWRPGPACLLQEGPQLILGVVWEGDSSPPPNSGGRLEMGWHTQQSRRQHRAGSGRAAGRGCPQMVGGLGWWQQGLTFPSLLRAHLPGSPQLQAPRATAASGQPGR